MTRMTKIMMMMKMMMISIFEYEHEIPKKKVDEVVENKNS